MYCTIKVIGFFLGLDLKMSLSKEELKPLVDRTVQKFLGFNEPAVVSAAVRCIVKGYDLRKTKGNFFSIIIFSIIC